jgi:hypothetical protein
VSELGPNKSTESRQFRTAAALLTALALTVAASSALAQPPQGAPPPAGNTPRPGGEPRPFGQVLFPGLPKVPLPALLDRVARQSHKLFVVDGRVAPDLYLGGVRPEDVTYAVLLSLLRANGLASVEINGRQHRPVERDPFPTHADRAS